MEAQGQLNEEHRVVIAGFGGQGILTLGELLCTVAMDAELHATYLPSYGSEVRGGTANCHVVVSPNPIFSPYVESADSLILLNQLSFERFVGQLKKGGLLTVNSSLVERAAVEQVRDARVIALPATETAAELGNVVVTNMVMLGAFCQASGIGSDGGYEAAMRKLWSGRKAALIELNLEAFAKGKKLAT